MKNKINWNLSINTIISLNREEMEKIKFIADIIEEKIKVDKSEQLDVQWIELDKVKNMTKDELRGFDTALNDIKNMENGKTYPLELFDTKIYRR